MAIHASTAVNNLLFVLIGERMIQADEDMAYASRLPYQRLGRRVSELTDLIETSVVSVGRSLPPQVGQNYVRSMRLFVDNGGTNYLREFADQLDTIAQGRVQTSSQITESKWQIIAEVVRLLIELAIATILSIFTGGASETQVATAKARSRVVVLTILDTLLSRTHVLPTLSEAFEEAFQTFAVRLAMIAFGPDGRRPNHFDWGQIAQDGLFGAVTALFHGAFSDITKNIAKFFGKDFFNSAVTKDITRDVTTKVTDTVSGKITGSVTNPSRFSVRNITRDAAHDGGDFVVEGGAEAMGEFVTSGLLTGNWSTSWSTFLGAGLSGAVESHLHEGAEHLGDGIGKGLGFKNATDLPPSERNTTEDGGADGPGGGGTGSRHDGGSRDVTESGAGLGVGAGVGAGARVVTGAGTGTGTGGGSGVRAGAGAGVGRENGSTSRTAHGTADGSSSEANGDASDEPNPQDPRAGSGPGTPDPLTGRPTTSGGGATHPATGRGGTNGDTDTTHATTRATTHDRTRTDPDRASSDVPTEGADPAATGPASPHTAAPQPAPEHNGTRARGDGTEQHPTDTDGATNGGADGGLVPPSAPHPLDAPRPPGPGPAPRLDARPEPPAPGGPRPLPRATSDGPTRETGPDQTLRAPGPDLPAPLPTTGGEREPTAATTATAPPEEPLASPAPGPLRTVSSTGVTEPDPDADARPAEGPGTGDAAAAVEPLPRRELAAEPALPLATASLLSNGPASTTSSSPLPAAPPPTRLVTRPVDRSVDAAVGRENSLRTLTGTTVPDDLVARQPLRTEDGSQEAGRGSYRDADWAVRQGRFGAVTAGTTYSDHRADRNALAGGPRDVPWRGRAVTYFAGHGSATRVTLALRDGTTAEVSGRELARYLAREAALGQPDRPVVLYSCSTGGSPVHGGLPVAQHVANLSGRTVYAPTTDAGTALDSTGRMRPVLYPDGDGKPGAWRTFTPEPAGAALDALARTAGLHESDGSADPWTANRTLQLVRTLRDTYGTGAEAAPEHTARLRGLAALDALRWNGTEGGRPRYADGRMTAELLRRMTRDLLGAPGTATPGPAHFDAVLHAADTARTGDPGAALDRLTVTPPAGSGPPGTAGATPTPAPAPPEEDGGTTSDGLREHRDSEVAAKERPVVATLNRPGGQRLDVLNVAGDGDCLFTAVIAGARRQLPGSPVRTSTISELRNAAATAFAAHRDQHPDEHEPFALEVLAEDLGGDQLTTLFGAEELPELSEADQAAVVETLVNTALRRRLLRQPLPARDRAAVADLPVSVVRELFPELIAAARADVDYPAVMSAFLRRRQQNLAAQQRTRLVDELNRPGRDADELWRRLLETAYPRWARPGVGRGPELSAVRGRRVGEMVTNALRDSSYWVTPFYDRVPDALALHLGVNITVVDQLRGADYALNEGARDTLYVHYNGRDHYSAVDVVTRATAVTPTPNAPDLATPPADPRGRRLVDLVRRLSPNSSEGYVASLSGISPATLTWLTDPASRVKAGGEPSKDGSKDGSKEGPAKGAKGEKGEGSKDGAAKNTPPKNTPPKDTPPKDTSPKDTPPKPAEKPAKRVHFADLPTRVEDELDIHRPPRMDRSLRPPPAAGASVVFNDGSRLPSYLTGDDTGTLDGFSYGHSEVTLRGRALVVREVADRTSAPTEIQQHLSRALRTRPESFHGDGYSSPPFTDTAGNIRVLRVRTRPHGRWQRFTDDSVHPVKVEAGHRSQTTAGSSMTAGQSRQAGVNVPIGPPSGVAGYGRVGGAAGRTRTYEYNLQNQTQTQVETRMGDGSHLHLDDVQYDVWMEGLPGRRPAGQLHRPFTDGESHFAFAVRNGLTARLADSETKPGTPGRAPERLSMGPQTDYRLVHTEGYGPVAGIRAWALKRAGAEPGSTAHAEISGFFTSESFGRMAERLHRGKVPTRQLLKEDAGRTPLGAFVVERVEPGAAVLLTETTAAEMRNTLQQTVRGERTLTTTYSQEISASAGPSFEMFGPNFPITLRGLIGVSGRYLHSVAHGTVLGGAGGRKIVGRAKKVPTDLYLVRKKVWVRMTGDAEAREFDTWSLDRMTRTEARRHAGWDDGTALRKQGVPPNAPDYLTPDRPAVLGMARPEAFTYEDGSRVKTAASGGGPKGGEPRTLLDEFTDQVIRAAAARHPDMIAPLEELGDANNPRWRDPELRRIALQNVLNIVNTLAHHSMAGNLEGTMTTGLRINLTGPGLLRRAHRWIWVDARLTERRYEGTQNDLILRSGAPGTDRLDGSQNVVRGYDAGFDVSVSVRDSHRDAAQAPLHLGTVQAGPRWGRQRARRTGYGSTASFEPLTISAAPSHLHSYKLELTAQLGGYSRPRNLWRGLATLGLLGTGLFVRPEPAADLIGGSAGTPVTGRVVLAVPDEHTPDSPAPHPRPVPPRTRLDAGWVRALARGKTGGANEDHPPDVFGDQPVATLSVGGHPELREIAEEVMADASGSSWHFAQSGAPAHDAMLRPLEPPYLTADFDQASGPAGTRIAGLFGKGPYRNRLGALVHRMRVRDPRVASPAVKIETEQPLGSDTQASGTVTTTQTFTLQGGASYGHSHPVGPSLAGSYGLLGRWGRARATSQNVTRTVTNEINRVDEGYKMLIVGDTEHDVLGSVRSEGLLAPLASVFTWNRASWAGRRIRFAADWLGHLPEKAVHRLDLLKDGLGEVPRYTAHGWSRPRWLRENPFGAYPVNTLDATAVLARFDARLREQGVDEAGRERVQAMVTPRVLKALRGQMTSTGAAGRTRLGGIGRRSVRIGGRTGALRIELIETGTVFDGLDHSVVFKDNRAANEVRDEGVSTAVTQAVGVGVNEMVRTGQEVVRGAGPVYGESGSSTRQTATTRGSARLKSHIFYPNEPHAEFLTDYRLRLTLTVGDDEPLREEGVVGTLREQVPLSLVTPELPPPAPPAPAAPATTATDGTAPAPAPAADPLGDPVVDPGPRRVTLWDRRRVDERAIAAWRTAKGGAFTAPVNGFQVRRIAGLTHIHEATDLAVATSYGHSRLPVPDRDRSLTGRPPAATGGPGSTRPRTAAAPDGAAGASPLDDALAHARDTGLTRPGTAAALALRDGTSDASLAAFFADSSGTDGYEVAGLTEDSFAGGAYGELRLYSRPDFAGATLLTVAPDSSMESAERTTDSSDVTAGRSGGQDSGLGAQPVIYSPDAGYALPGGQSTLANATDTNAVKYAGADGSQLDIKPKTGRSFLFAIPTDWLGVAEIERSFKDSAVGSWLGRALGPFGYVKPGPQAVETRTQVLAWVREDVARQLGLITDDGFPPRVADAWKHSVAASKAWVEADKAYWKKRRAVPELRARLAASEGALTEARKAAGLDGAGAAPGRADGDASDPPEIPAPVARAQADREAAEQAHRLAVESLPALLATAEAAAATFHAVRAGADRLTRWHRLPPGPHGRDAVPEPPAVDFKPAAKKPAPQRDTYAGGAGTLTGPDGTEYELLAAPADGDGFFHALAEGLARTPDGLPDDLDTTSRAALVTGLRGRLATALDSAENADLIPFTAPDTTDTFSALEAVAAGVPLLEGSPELREFVGSGGHMPLHQVLGDGERGELAALQIRRPGGTDGRGGWDHGAADLLPALAARTYGVTVSVVRADGSFQVFGPDPLGDGAGPAAPADDEASRPHLVLHVKDRHYVLAVPKGDPDLPDDRKLPPPAAAEAAAKPAPAGARPAYRTAPWEEGAAEPDADHFGRGPDPARLTGPDGAEYELVEPAGDGNGFWGAVLGADADPDRLVSGYAPPEGARLNRTAPFTVEEVKQAGVTLKGADADHFQDSGGLLPPGLALTDRQERALIRAQLRTARLWDGAAEAAAVALTADRRRISVTVVGEDGTFRTHRPVTGPASADVVVFRRGGDYLAARQTRPGRPPAAPEDDPAFLKRKVRLADVEGMAYEAGAGATWQLNPKATVEIGELKLPAADRAALFAKLAEDPKAKKQKNKKQGGDQQGTRQKEQKDTKQKGGHKEQGQPAANTSGHGKPRVLWQPGYATGDQFGIAAALLGDPALHVVLVGGSGSDTRDKSDGMARFYRESGVPSGRVHVVQAPSLDNTAMKAAALTKTKELLTAEAAGLNDKQIETRLLIPVGSGTTWVAERFSPEVRGLVRSGWGLDGAHFGPEDHQRVQDWLAARGVTVTKGRRTIVVWSRFSGKRGDVHVEHDTSYHGVRQILEALNQAGADGGSAGDDPAARPLVLIAGDRHADPAHAAKYPEMVRELSGQGLDVHDLTDFWNDDPQGIATWGGDTRIGQLRLYEYLHAASGDLRHLGFRSGNLEALAMAGHTVRYMEEPGSVGAQRMEKWHRHNNTDHTRLGGLAPGYERLVVDSPPTRSGKFLRDFPKSPDKSLEKSGTERDEATEKAGRANTAKGHERPPWLFGRGRTEPKPADLRKLDKGFTADDLTKILAYLRKAAL
ncbi:hypothetical protein ACFO3J_23335 [Streptomyces polygonati]|uniref:OTU domain-containing protein n=1 Tax=Streptomyces polygonati TaxID=1617087 RepID=A0ABV8HQS3_9ACTN